MYSAPDKPLTKHVRKPVCDGNSRIVCWYVDHAQLKLLLTRQQRHHLDGTHLTIVDLFVEDGQSDKCVRGDRAAEIARAYRTLQQEYID
jgi:hypothetical protein